MERRCDKCEWWAVDDDLREHVGWCLRNPPSIGKDIGGGFTGDWPTTLGKLWCGQFLKITLENPKQKQVSRRHLLLELKLSGLDPRAAMRLIYGGVETIQDAVEFDILKFSKLPKSGPTTTARFKEWQDRMKDSSN